MASLPFALLQAAQVALLDGDVFIAKAVLDPQEAEFTGVLVLFQRIEFFACFGLASVLLPSLTAALPLAVLFIMVSLPILISVFNRPEVLMSILQASSSQKQRRCWGSLRWRRRHSLSATLPPFGWPRLPPCPSTPNCLMCRS
ncbi:MAG: hypothetical protein V7661_16885 [Sulfitobacter sp.]